MKAERPMRPRPRRFSQSAGRALVPVTSAPFRASLGSPPSAGRQGVSMSGIRPLERAPGAAAADSRIPTSAVPRYTYAAQEASPPNRGTTHELQEHSGTSAPMGGVGAHRSRRSGRVRYREAAGSRSENRSRDRRIRWRVRVSLCPWRRKTRRPGVPRDGAGRRPSPDLARSRDHVRSRGDDAGQTSEVDVAHCSGDADPPSGHP